MKTFPIIPTAPRMHFQTACDFIHAFAEEHAQPYEKVAMENIVVPSMNPYGFASAQVACVSSKEEPTGEVCYGGHMVVRIIEGRLVEEGTSVYDAYTWSAKKLASNIDIGGCKPIGRGSSIGMKNFAELYSTLVTERDRELFCLGFMPYAIDLMLVHTPAEKKECIEVTQELYDAGLRYWADDWRASDAAKDEEGMVKTTPLSVGDLLAISPEGAYVVAAKVAKQTYRKI